MESRIDLKVYVRKHIRQGSYLILILISQYALELSLYSVQITMISLFIHKQFVWCEIRHLLLVVRYAWHLIEWNVVRDFFQIIYPLLQTKYTSLVRY